MGGLSKLVVVFLVALLVLPGLVACGGDTTPTPDPALVQDRFQKGNEYAQAGDFEKAVVEYQAVLEAEPENVSALTNLGVVYYSLGKLDESIAQYNRALELAPQDADIRSNLAAAYVQKGDLDKALETYQQAIDLDPSLAEAHFGLGVIYMQLGNAEQARQAFVKFQEYDTGKDPLASEKAQEYLEQLGGQ